MVNPLGLDHRELPTCEVNPLALDLRELLTCEGVCLLSETERFGLITGFLSETEGFLVLLYHFLMSTFCLCKAFSSEGVTAVSILSKESLF